MTILNSGLLFRKKYESNHNAIRRFLLANDGLTRARYGVLNGHSLASSEALELIKKTQTTKYWKANPWLEEHAWLAIDKTDSYLGERAKRAQRCPMCMDEVFHSHFQSFPWVARCPLHDVDLTERCPRCGGPWPVYDELTRIDCPTCGTVRPQSFAHRRCQIQGHTRTQQAILGVFWSLTGLERLFCRIIYLDFIPHGWDAGILTGSREFPELAVTLFPEHAPLLARVGSPASGLNEMRFDASPLPSQIVQSMPVNRPIPMGFARDAMDETDREIRAALKQVPFPDAEPRTSRHVYVDCIDDYSISELAYDAWRAIVWQPGAQVAPSGWWSRIFELLALPQPEVPAIVNVVVTNDGTRFVEPSDDFRGWMYKMQLKNLFCYLYRHAFVLKALLATGDPSGRLARFQREGELLWPHRYNSFRVRITANNRLQVVYLDFPSWTNIFAVGSVDAIYANASYDILQSQTRKDVENFSDEFVRYLGVSRTTNLYDCIRHVLSWSTKRGVVPHIAARADSTD